MKPTKRERIIEKATELFFSNGILATSMDDIAAQTPVAKMTIYKYFQSKEGLLGEVADRYIKRQHRLLQSFIDNYPEPIEALLAMLNYKQENIPEQFLKELVEFHPKFVEQMMDYYKKHMLVERTRLIFEGQQRGQIRSDISPHVLMLYTQSLKEFLSKPEIIKEISDFHVVGQQITTMYLYGIVTPQYRGRE